MSENSTLRIHTRFAPDTSHIAAAPEPKRQGGRRARRPTGRATRPARKRLSAGDRLLRNSAVACAVLLGVLALGNVRQPWAQKAREGIERALTMRINLDDTLGELTFVRKLMPESALVFLNVSGSATLTPPVSGSVVHPYSALQPWLMFGTKDAPVCAPGAGTVSAVSELSGGQYGLLIDHGQGLESVCAGLSAVSVQSGETVARGQVIGQSGEGLYFELRSGGEAVDPTERLGVK